MGYYLQLVVLTDKGRKNFDDDPEWIKAVDKEIELLGAKILTQYALLGQFDFVNVIEAASDEVLNKVSRVPERAEVVFAERSCFEPPEHVHVEMSMAEVLLDPVDGPLL